MSSKRGGAARFSHVIAYPFCSPLELAILACSGPTDSSLVEALVQARADVHVRTRTGRTLLHTASMAPHTSPAIAAALIAAGADPNRTALGAAGAFRETPLHRAAMEGEPAIAEQLLRAGARVEEPNALGESPLHLAARAQGKGAEVTVRLLLLSNADVSKQTARGLVRRPLRLCSLGVVCAVTRPV